MYLTGDAALDPQGTVLQTLADLLTAKLALSPYAAWFAAYGGVRVLHTNDPASMRVFETYQKRPVILLSVSSSEPQTPPSRLEIEVMAEVLTSDYSYPVTGKASSALLSIVEHEFAALQSAGLHLLEAKAGQGQRPDPNRINPHALMFLVCLAS